MVLAGAGKASSVDVRVHVRPSSDETDRTSSFRGPQGISEMLWAHATRPSNRRVAHSPLLLLGRSVSSAGLQVTPSSTETARHARPVELRMRNTRPSGPAHTVGWMTPGPGMAE